MRKLLVTASLVWLAWGIEPTGAQENNARSLLEKAIAAHGGERMAKARTFSRNVKGEISSFGAAVPCTAEFTVNLPEQGRWVFELETAGQKVLVSLGMNREKGWRSSGGAVKEMSKQEWEELHEEMYLSWVTTLLPVLEGGLTIESVPEIKIGEAMAPGIKVNSKGHAEIKLYFDKKTNLLAKAERKGKEAGIEVTKEYLFSDYKEANGLKLPMKYTEIANGKKMAEWTVVGSKFQDKFDDAVFAKP